MHTTIVVFVFSGSFLQYVRNLSWRIYEPYCSRPSEGSQDVFASLLRRCFDASIKCWCFVLTDEGVTASILYKATMWYLISYTFKVELLQTLKMEKNDLMTILHQKCVNIRWSISLRGSGLNYLYSYSLVLLIYNQRSIIPKGPQNKREKSFDWLKERKLNWILIHKFVNIKKKTRTINASNCCFNVYWIMESTAHLIIIKKLKLHTVSSKVGEYIFKEFTHNWDPVKPG